MYDLMNDKNGVTMHTGDVVKIEGAYFKNDNGLYFVDHAPNDPNWTGGGYSLVKISKRGKISTAKYNLAFWPLCAFTNDRSKNAEAKAHNAANATIEVINGIDPAEIIKHFSEKAAEHSEAAETYAYRFGDDSETTQKARTISAFYKSVADRLTGSPAEPEAVEVAEEVEPEQMTLDFFTEAPAEPETITEEAPEAVPEPEATPAPEEVPDNDYFIENKETGKIELYFDKSTYMALSDTEKQTIKSTFLFSRHTGAWISRCKFPRLYWARKVAEDLGLYNAGTTGERLTFEEQQERKIEKAEARADRYEYKAGKAEAKAEALQAPINRMHGDIAFFTQPNINTSAGRAFTRQRNRMWESYERGFDEFRKSEYYQHRAEIARSAKEIPTKGFCQRRIEDAQKTIRAQQRNLKSYEDKLNRINAGEVVKSWSGEPFTAETVTGWIDEATEIINTNIEKVAYYDALIQQQGGIVDRKSLQPGQLVIVERWGKVKYIKGGPKNFTFEFLQPHMKYADGTPMIGQAAYAEIKEVC